MIRHVVMFRFKPDTPAAARASMAEGLAGLSARIPEIRSWSQGSNIMESDRNYDFCLVGDFESEAALQVYQDHPAHQQVIRDRIRPIVDSVVVVDFSF